jgi:hypothetical protein
LVSPSALTFTHLSDVKASRTASALLAAGFQKSQISVVPLSSEGASPRGRTG